MVCVQSASASMTLATVTRLGRPASRGGGIAATTTDRHRPCRATLRSVPPPTARGISVERAPTRRSRVVSHSCPPLQHGNGSGWRERPSGSRHKGPSYAARRSLSRKGPQPIFQQLYAGSAFVRDDQRLRVASPYASDYELDHSVRRPVDNSPSSGHSSNSAAAGASSSYANRMEESITGTVRLRISVYAAPSHEGLQLKVVGGRKALGNWDPMKAIELSSSPDGKWVADVVVPPGPLKFKVIAQTTAGRVYAEKGLRKLEVPSDRIAQVLSGCYFNAHCVWGSPGDISVQAVRLSPEERKAEIEDAELQVAKLRERQARLKAKMQDISGEIMTTNSVISTINSDVKQTIHEVLTARRKAQTAAGSDGHPSVTASHSPASQAKELDGPMDSLFQHPLWSGTDAAPQKLTDTPEVPQGPSAVALSDKEPVQPQETDPQRAAEILRQVEGPGLLLAAIAFTATQAAGQVFKGMKTRSYAAVASAAIFASLAL